MPTIEPVGAGVVVDTGVDVVTFVVDGAGADVVTFVVVGAGVPCPDVGWPVAGLPEGGVVGFGADVVGCADVPWPDVGWPAVGLSSDVGFAVEVGLPEVEVAEVGCAVLGSEEPGVDGFVVVGSGVP